MAASMQFLDLNICRSNIQASISWPGVAAYTCNPASLEVEFWKGAHSVPVESYSPSICGGCMTTYNAAEGEEPGKILGPNNESRFQVRLN